MQKYILMLLAVIMLVSLAGCEKQGSPATENDIGLAGFSTGNTEFAVDLYRKLLETEQGNFFYSPYSISEVLAMTYAGARNQTEQQMADTLHFTLPQEQLHSSFKSIDQKLASRGEGAEGKDGEGFRLKVANALWGQEGYEFLSEFKETIFENYGSGIRQLNFANGEESCITINNWVSEQTENRIKNLVSQISPSTMLILTNAVYFNAAWAHSFKKEATEIDSFYPPEGKSKSTPMMNQTTYFKYANSFNYQAVELPYNGLEQVMIIIMPINGQFNNFEKSFTGEKLTKIIDQFKSRRVDLTLPKFEYESTFQLSDMLVQMGMTDAFSDKADFSAMSANSGFQIDQVDHKSFVSVDEAGTEAAAATAVRVTTGIKRQPRPVVMKVDHPFIFAIRDVETGTILFLGRVVTP